MEALEAALRQKDAGAHIFFAPKSLRAGSYFLPELAKEIAKSTAFVLLVGEKGIGRWQVIEYYEAFDRRIKEPSRAWVAVPTTASSHRHERSGVGRYHWQAVSGGRWSGGDAE